MTENNTSADTIANSTNVAGNACDKLIEAIEPLAVQNGVEMVLLHGEHESDLENVGMLLSVNDMEGFLDNAYGEIAFEAIINHKLCGGIIPQPSERFPNGYEDMLSWLKDSIKSKGYERKGDRLVAIA